jgi:HK97 family phage major capsid protein
VAIRKAVTVSRQSYLEPDGLVIHPANHEAVDLIRDTQGGYIGGGPYNPAGATIWGLRVVVTEAIASGTALVGSFMQAAQVYRRGGVTVEASNSHSDFFRKNLTAIRAESRLALAVYRPESFVTVTGLD